jgi:hypothetical protein
VIFFARNSKKINDLQSSTRKVVADCRILGVMRG